MNSSNEQQNADKSRKAILKEFDQETPKGFFKLRSYFLSLLENKEFIDKIIQLRKRYHIPKEAFPYKGLEMPPPDEWLKKWANEDIFEKLRKDCKKLCDRFELYDFPWQWIVQDYVFFNYVDLSSHLHSFDRCQIKNLLDDEKEYFSDSEFGYIFRLASKQEKRAFPIAICISPYASRNDIIDYVKKNYKHILIYQKNMRGKNTKIMTYKRRNPHIQTRNAFIYKNRNLPRKKIASLVTDKFREPLDVGLIGKIISEENKKRTGSR